VIELATIDVTSDIDGLDTMLRMHVQMRTDPHIGGRSMDMRNGGYAYACPHDFVLQHGTAYTSDAFELVEGSPRACYSNSLRAAAENGWQYVEGYAFGPSGLGLDIHHAWCVKPDGTPVECTWEEPGVAYRGVVFPLPVVLDALDATGSVLDDWMRDFPILKKRWQG
jgi:hypothetical protein